MVPSDDRENVDVEDYYKLDKDSTVTVEDCPYCGETHTFSIDPRWETIQKARTGEVKLPQDVKKFIVECPKQRSLFEIFVKVK